MTEEFFSKRFPTIYGECHNFGIKVPKKPIPVRPAQHYHMGGIKTDLDGRTNIEGLYACGECASTGIHGANRLASNSLLECLVFGRRTARHICGSTLSSPTIPAIMQDTSASRTLSSAERDELILRIRNLMTRDVAAIRTTAGLTRAMNQLNEIADSLAHTALKCQADYALYSMVQTASLIVIGALARKESVGAHYLVD